MMSAHFINLSPSSLFSIAWVFAISLNVCILYQYVAFTAKLDFVLSETDVVGGRRSAAYWLRTNTDHVRVSTGTCSCASGSQCLTLMSYFFCSLFVPGLHTQIPPPVYRSPLRSNYLYRTLSTIIHPMLSFASYPMLRLTPHYIGYLTPAT